ncbi:hypothetical protein PspLS_00348 [Pyricularia sp. CBS 133598]|nr:hypothetical protein PspLS_00348 [Pyricularia sp. CBS 133598]
MGEWWVWFKARAFFEGWRLGDNRHCLRRSGSTLLLQV